jgi:hypothetical protein
MNLVANVNSTQQTLQNNKKNEEEAEKTLKVRRAAVFCGCNNMY